MLFIPGESDIVYIYDASFIRSYLVFKNNYEICQVGGIRQAFEFRQRHDHFLPLIGNARYIAAARLFSGIPELDLEYGGVARLRVTLQPESEIIIL